jgi:glycosyltransferase involved in cell wall biosynthesis
MHRPLVTVVTPSYNQGQYIRKTIESVLSQDYPNLEYIIMDGGSNDATAAIVKDYSSRLTYISEGDRGQSHAINKGFQMARGDIVAWLNSDDLYLPGSIGKAISAFHRQPGAGAVYGEGYLIDSEGRIQSRFPHTQEFDLWRLMYLSDYILQQTVFFRKTVLQEIGPLDESLHYTMDWDILIRIAKSYSLAYTPEYLGCLREHAEAKTTYGGSERAQEILRMLRGHTGRYLPPGYLVYGLDTYQRLYCDRIGRTVPVYKLSYALQWAIRTSCGLVIDHVLKGAQGLSSDGWACRMLRYMLSPGRGPIVIQGELPHWSALKGQRIQISANGHYLGSFDLPWGDFERLVEVPPQLEGKLLQLEIRASRGVSAGCLEFPGDWRRLAYRLRSLHRGDSQKPKLETAWPDGR